MLFSKAAWPNLRLIYIIILFVNVGQQLGSNGLFVVQITAKEIGHLLDSPMHHLIRLLIVLKLLLH